jgi:hypothetical protein
LRQHRDEGLASEEVPLEQAQLQWQRARPGPEHAEHGPTLVPLQIQPRYIFEALRVSLVDGAVLSATTAFDLIAEALKSARLQRLDRQPVSRGCWHVRHGRVLRCRFGARQSGCFVRSHDG